MQIKLSPDDIETIISEADSSARRLRRRLGLPDCDREDLGQDLLIDLLRRLPAFDPARGSLGGLRADTVQQTPLLLPRAPVALPERHASALSGSSYVPELLQAG